MSRVSLITVTQAKPTPRSEPKSPIGPILAGELANDELAFNDQSRGSDSERRVVRARPGRKRPPLTIGRSLPVNMRLRLLRIFAGRDIAPAVLTLVAVVVGFRIVRFFMVPYAAQVGSDEGYEAAAVERIIDGHWLPYVDCVSHRGPFLYWTQAVLHLLLGRFELTGTRMLGLLSFLTTTATAFLAGWAARRPLAGAIAAATNVFVLAIVYAPGGGVGVHGEPVAMPYVMTAFFLVAFSLYRARTDRGRTLLLIAGGVLVGVAGFTKQTVAVASAPMLLWVFVHGLGNPSALSSEPLQWRRALTRGLLPFAAGGVALVVLVLARYAVVGELGTFLYWSTSYNTNVYMEPYKGQIIAQMKAWFFAQPWAMLSVAFAVTVGVVRPLAQAQRSSVRGLVQGVRDAGFEMTVALTGIALLVSGAMPLRLWPHYFLPVFPFFGMTLGIVIESVVRRGSSVPARAQWFFALAIGAVLVTSGEDQLSSLKQERAVGYWPNPRPDPACAEIDRIAGPGKDPIFVWGMVGDIYIACRRRSASKFTYTTVVAGVVPPFWDAPLPSRVGRGSRETLMSELTSHPPPVIIDSVIGLYGRMLDIPVFSDFLTERYCRVSVGADGHGRLLTYYARKGNAACPK